MTAEPSDAIIDAALALRTEGSSPHEIANFKAFVLREVARLAYDERCRCALVAKRRGEEWYRAANERRAEKAHHLADRFTGRVEAAEALAFEFHGGQLDRASSRREDDGTQRN